MSVITHLFRDRIHEHFNINFFKDEESGKMSADSAHVQGTSEGESIDLSALSDPHSLTVDVKYVFIFQTYLLFKYYVTDAYHLVINIMRISSSFFFFN